MEDDIKKPNYQIWRLWTYQFVHNGYVHLVTNLLYQMIFGVLLEIVHGPLRVGALYTIGVIFGGVFSMTIEERVTELISDAK